MKKIISILCAFLLLAAILVLPVSAASFPYFNTDKSPLTGKVILLDKTIEPGETGAFSFYLVSDGGKWCQLVAVTPKDDNIEVSCRKGSQGGTEGFSLPSGVSYHFMNVVDCQTTNDRQYLRNEIYVNGKLFKSYNTDFSGATGKLNWVRYEDSVNYAGYLDTYAELADYMKDFAAEMTGSEECIVTPAENQFGSEHIITLVGSKTLADVRNEITLSEGAVLSATHNGTALTDADEVKRGDRLAVTSKNGKVINYYTVLVAEAEISSDFYDINIGEKSISGVLRYTPADKFISRINIADGYEIDGIYNGNEKITSATVSAGNTLKLSNGSAYTISCVSDVVSGNGSYVRCYLKNETGHALQWQDNESGGAYSRLAIDVSMPKERSKTWQLRPIVKNSENMFMECSVGNSFYFVNDRFTDRGNEVLALAGDSDTIDIRLIVDLSSETGGSLTVYVNGHYLDCYYSNKFRNAFVPAQNGGEGYSEIYLTTSGGEKTRITSFFIDSTEELEKEITDFYDRIIFTDNNGSITASLTPSSYDNGMLILVSYDEAKGCIGGISVTRVTKKQETFKAALSADSIKGKVKAMYWSDKIEHRLLAEYN